jgi:hypothetical protein
MPERSALIAACGLMIAAAPILGGEAPVAAVTDLIVFTDASGFPVSSINLLAAIGPAGLPGPFGGTLVFYNAPLGPGGLLPAVDLTDPAYAPHVARLTNGVDDDLWFGGGSLFAGDFARYRETAVFGHLGGVDLAGFVPTRIETRLDDISFFWDGVSRTYVFVVVTTTFFADLPPCNDADLVEPNGVLDLADVTAFVERFLAGDPAVDIAPPDGLLDLRDIVAFVGQFVAGCP